MEKVLRYSFMVIAVLCVVGLILLGVNSIGRYQDLVSNPAVGSEDYLGYGLLFGTSFLFTSIFGIVMSVLGKKYADDRWENIVCYTTLGICSAGVLVAAFFWFKFGFM
jgi:hypothetical protein